MASRTAPANVDMTRFFAPDQPKTMSFNSRGEPILPSTTNTPEKKKKKTKKVMEPIHMPKKEEPKKEKPKKKKEPKKEEPKEPKIPENEKFVKVELKKAKLSKWENPLAQAGYNTWDQLVMVPSKDLSKLVHTLGMTPNEINRLYKQLGRKPGLDVLMAALSKKAKPNKPARVDPSKKPKKKKQAPLFAPAPPKKQLRNPSGGLETVEAAPPAPVPKKIDASALPQARGGSKWNPGNTVESRNYCEAAQERVREELTDFELAPGIKVIDVTKVDGDLSVIVSRGKVKCIYDFSFEVEWKGVLNGKGVKGTLMVSDIMPDDEDWVVQGKTESWDAQYLIASAQNQLIPRLNQTIFLPMMLHYKSKQFQGYTFSEAKS